MILFTFTSHLVLVQEHLQLHDADPQIGFVELVRDVPSQGSELASLLDGGVEKAQTVQQFLENVGLLATLEPFQVGDRIAHVRTGDVRSQTFGRLVGHFYTVLQDQDRKMFCGIGGQPEAEVRVGRVGCEVFTDLEYNIICAYDMTSLEETLKNK